MAYQALQKYFQLGPDRSLAAVAQELGKSRQLIGRWSAAHHWVARTETYVTEQHAAHMAAEQQAALERARKLLDRRQQAEDDAWEAFGALKTKVRAMLSWPLARRTVTGTGQDDGSMVTYEPTTNWRLGDVARLAQAMELMRRVALGEAVSAQEMRTMAAQVTTPSGQVGTSTPQCIITINNPGPMEEDEIVPLPSTPIPGEPVLHLMTPPSRKTL